MRCTLTLCFTPSTLLVEHFTLKLMSEQKMGKKNKKTQGMKIIMIIILKLIEIFFPVGTEVLHL